MKHITEKFENSRSISDLVEESRIDEGLKDIFKSLKEKFKKVVKYLKGLVVNVGSYFLPVDDEGNIQPAITPPTAGQAYKDGAINKSSTYVAMGKDESKIVNQKLNRKQAEALYGSGNSLQYWKRSVKECLEKSGKSINEVRMQNTDPEAKYNVIVDDAVLKTKIKMVLKNRKLARLLIWGAPGIGKTAILNSVLDEYEEFKDYNLIVKTLSNETPDNFTLPKYTIEDGQEKATDVPKTWLPVYKPTGDAAKDAELDEKCGKGLLFIDELSRATQQVLNVMLPLINEGSFNEYKMGSGWTIICASNRMEDEMSGQSELGNALANRFTQVYYEPCVKTWEKWAKDQNYISPLLLQWLSMPESENMSGGKFFYMDPNEDSNGDVTKLMCTPRAWTNAMRELAEYSETGSLEGWTIFDVPRDIIAMTLNSYVPAQAVDGFLAFLEVISRIGNFDQAVYDIWQNGGGSFKINKKDLNLITLPLAQLVCTAHADKLPTEEEFVNLANWLVAQNSDQLCSYTLDVFKNVFMSSVSETLRDVLFVLQIKLAKGMDDNLLNGYKDTYAAFTNKWGIDLESMPNYATGLRIISKKYQQAFKSAIINGVETLG